jgi:hypothetical protein
VRAQGPPKTFKTYSFKSLRKTQAKAVFEWGPVRALGQCYGFLKTVTLRIQEYNSWINTLAHHHGIRYTTKVLKDLHSTAKLSVIGVRVPLGSLGGKWVTTYHTGIPKVLPNLNKLCTGSYYERRLAVTITSYVELLRVKPEIDLKSITDPFKGQKAEVQLWAQWCEDYSKRHWTKVRTPAHDDDRYHTSMSRGPNGGASLLSRGIDSLYLVGGPHWTLFKEACSLWKRYDLVKSAIETSNQLVSMKDKISHKAYHLEQGHLARLIPVPDKAGKTRTVYCLTWWFQELLHKFHKDLYRILYSIKEDGTRNHRNAAAQVKLWTAEGRKLWSVDLSNATDRFPMELQVAVVAGLHGTRFAQIWKRIMGVKPWSGTEYVSYSVGQPMGAKTSWAAFSLTHHTILRLLCQAHGISGQAYVIVGDDIVISNDKVATSYMGLLEDFGVDYSPKKTISPEKADASVAEFAKRIFRDGLEYSPLTLALLDRIYTHRSYAVFISLLQELKGKWDQGCDVYDTHLRFHPPAWYLFQLLPKSWKEDLAVVIGSVEALPAPEGGKEVTLYIGEVDNPWKEIDPLTYGTALYSSVSRLLSGYLESLIKIREWVHKGRSVEPRIYGRFVHVPSHPINLVLRRIEKVIKDCARGIDEGDLNLTRVQDLGLDLKYMEDLPNTRRSWEAHKRLLERRNVRGTQFWKTVYQNCLNPEDMYY